MRVASLTTRRSWLRSDRWLTAVRQGGKLLLSTLVLKGTMLRIYPCGAASFPTRGHDNVLSPPPVIPAYLSIELSLRPTMLSLIGFSFMSEHFDVPSFAKLKNVCQCGGCFSDSENAVRFPSQCDCERNQHEVVSLSAIQLQECAFFPCSVHLFKIYLIRYK